tara:strand:- start:133 stop:1233 length:1101 start_codon:yes stop_codon:yes gene_type:complete
MKHLILSILISFSFVSNAQKDSTFSLDIYLSENLYLDAAVDSIFSTLNVNSIVAQLLMPAVGRLGQHKDTIKSYIESQLIGGVLLLNGTKEQFKGWTSTYEKMNSEIGNLPFLYSADAEPSLVNRKMIGSKKVPRANAIKSLEEVTSVTKTISNDLNDVGVNYNFSPVVDVAKNTTVGYRGFNYKPENVIPFSAAFIEQTQKQNIVATAKHFPGHGLITGDTHKSLQIIDGELKELKNYPPLIDGGVLSVMIAHIAVKNNELFGTSGLPSTLSENMVKNLLRDSLNFKGLIVTDAMNMGGVAKVPQAAMKALDAGCDIILMPLNVRKAHKNILEKYLSDEKYKVKVETAAKRVIRMKICLGLIEIN